MDKIKIPKGINRNLLKKYRASSINTLTLNFKKLLIELYNVEKYSLQPFNDFIKFKEYIEKQEKQSIQKNYMAAALSFLKADIKTPEPIIKKYQDYFNQMVKIIDEAKLYKEPTKKEEESFVSWEEIIKIYNKHKKDIEEYPNQIFPSYEDKYKYLHYLLLTLYTTIPPLRGEEYRNAIILKVKDITNYDIITESCSCNLIDIKNNNLVIKHYKTSKTHGTRIIPIPKETIEIIKKWYEITNQNKYLLPNLQTPNQKMSQSSLSHLLQRIFKPHNISTSMLRKIYISEKLKTIRNKPKERKELAKIMGHTLPLQEFIYNKFNIT